LSNFCGIHDLFWPAEPLSPDCGRGQAGLYAFAESDSFLLRDRGENRDHRILKDPAGIEVRLGETEVADAGRSQSVEMSEGFEDAFASEAIERPKQEQVKTAMRDNFPCRTRPSKSLGFKSPLCTKFTIPCGSNYFQTLMTIDLPSPCIVSNRLSVTYADL
jgi:hypothetical protein